MYLTKSVRIFFGTNAERTASGLAAFLPGDEYYETDTTTTYVHDGMQWREKGSVGSDTFDVDDLTTATGSSGEMVRVASGGGLEYRTPDEVLGDIGIVLDGIGKLDDTLISVNDESDHFRQNTTGAPTGWTQVDAANSTATNSLYSYWNLNGSSAETSWKYRKQTDTTLESLTANFSAIYVFGPLYWRDAAYTADVDYYFGLYRDNSGIDEDTYSRVHLQWSRSGSVWRVRGELKDSSSGTQKVSTWQSFSFPLSMPVYFAVAAVNNASKSAIQYIGKDRISTFFSILQNTTPDTALSWGQMWLQVHQTRGAGGGDILYIGSYDRVF